MLKTLKKIVKRNGRIEKFEAKKLTKAIEAAGKHTGEFDETIAKQLTVKVLQLGYQLFQDHLPTSDEVAGIVEDVLMGNYKSSAKAFILFRDQQQRHEEISSKSNVTLIKQYLKKNDWQVNENSNQDYSLQGLNNYIASEISKTFWLNEIYPKDIRDAHKNGEMHIHDLSAISVYCVGWDLYDVLFQGFRGVANKTESKPAKHLRTALGQIVNFFYTLQGESAGAQAFSNFDTLLAPFIRYDKLTYKEIKQAIQEFIFNMNVPTRVGFQTPFTNLTFDLTPSPNYKDQPVVIGGEIQKETYGEFQAEMDLINKAFLEIMLAGDAKGRIFTFPIPTYNITHDFDWDNDNVNLLWEVTGKYGMPYFSNFINSDMKPEDARSMCCRLRLNTKELNKRGGGLFGSNPLTGSIGVVTINMPRIGFNAKTEDDFITILNHQMNLAKESLEIKRKILEKFTIEDLYPYTKYYLRTVHDRFNEYWKNHFSTIGLVGLNEACLNLFGEDIGTKRGKKFACKVMDFMNKKLIDFQKETDNNYNLEATPAEGTSYRLALGDKKYDKNVICANEEAYRNGAEPYYTNSSQLPVDYTTDILEALDLQDELQCKYTGGTVIHLYLGEQVDDVQIVKKMVRKICERYHLPYFSLTPTFSICPNHGYIRGQHQWCPKCDEEIIQKVQEDLNGENDTSGE